jgi:hypothetical protein
MSHYGFSYPFPVTDVYRISVQYRARGSPTQEGGYRGVATGQKALGNFVL